MSKHFQIGDVIRCRRTKVEGRVYTIGACADGSIYYAIETDLRLTCAISHGDAELVEPATERYKGVTIADLEEIAAKWAAQYVNPFIAAVASQKPAPKFKAGDRVRFRHSDRTLTGEVRATVSDRTYTVLCESPDGSCGLATCKREDELRPAASTFHAVVRHNGSLRGIDFQAEGFEDAESLCKTLGATLDGEVG